MSDKIDFYLTESEKPSKKQTVYQKIHEFIQKHYIIRFNEIALTYEIARRDDMKFATLNESSLLISMVNSGLKVSNLAL